MGELAQTLGTMSPAAVNAVTRLETEVLKFRQIDIKTDHAFHAGMYVRTIMIPAGVVLTGALIKIPTVLIVSGTALVYTDKGTLRIQGYGVLLGKAGRKQAFVSETDTYLTMIFPTDSTTVEEAEAEFTDETDKLMSRNSKATNTVAPEA